MKIKRHFIMASRYQSTGFFVRGTGHFIIHSKELTKTAYHGEIFWGIDGTGEFLLNHKKYKLRPNSIFYYPPNSFHDITPFAPYFNYRWLSIEGEDADTLFRALGFTPGIMADVGTCPEDLFAKLELHLQCNTKEDHLKALNTAFEILTYAVSPKSVNRPILEQIKDFIDDNFWKMELDVTVIASYFHIHRVSMSRKFQEQYGIAPSEYLSSLRLQHGIKLLTTTHFSAKEIAAQCGYSNADYFAKTIRKSTGLSLRQIRGDYR